MDKHRPYNGRRSSTHRRRSSSSSWTSDDKTKAAKRALRLYICIGLLAAAVFVKFAFPTAFTALGDKLDAAVNYKAALTVLGEGISGEKKFTAALGEAFTYAFTGRDTDEAGESPEPSGEEQTASPSPEASDAAVSTMSDPSPADEVSSGVRQSFADAVAAAFLQDQATYSDYAIPAGVSYGMPKLVLDYAVPLVGTVTQRFGYNSDMDKSSASFNFGVEIASKSDAKVTSFADGKVIAAGSTDALGNYVVVRHGGAQTQYAQCGQVLVTIGQTVKKGDAIATAGRLGDTDVTGVNFKLKLNGIYVNPEFYVEWS